MPIRCVIIRGFRLDRGFAQPGHELELPEEEFERLHGAGAVRRASEVVQESEDDLKARMELFRACHKREPSTAELAHIKRVSTPQLRAELEAWTTAQEDFQRASAARSVQRETNTQALLAKQAADLEKAAQKTRASAKRSRDPQA